MKLSRSEAIIANAAALAETLGCRQRDVAKSALALVFGICESNGDPDGLIAALMREIKRDTDNGR